MENKICVYAIAKNEEAFAARWYNSMKEADKVIVLDTGSSDGTIELLRELGAEVYEQTYETFRFDEARNDSLKYVPDEYNIRVCTDLDELFEPGWAEILRQEWNPEIHHWAEYMYTHDHLETGENGFSFILNKIHGPGFHWEHAVHEHLYPDELLQQENALHLEDKIHLHHYPDKEKSRTQYLNLLETRLKEEPENFFGYVQYALELEAHDRYEEAISCANFILDNFTIPNPIESAGLYCHIGENYKSLEQPQKAIAAYSQGIFVDPEYRENYFCLARLYYDLQMFDMAIGILEEMFIRSKRKYHWLEGVNSWASSPYSLLAFCYGEKGNYEKAVLNTCKALAFEPNHPELQQQYSWYLEKTFNN